MSDEAKQCPTCAAVHWPPGFKICSRDDLKSHVAELEEGIKKMASAHSKDLAKVVELEENEAKLQTAVKLGIKACAELEAEAKLFRRILIRLDTIASGGETHGTENEWIQPAVEKIVVIRNKLKRAEAHIARMGGRHPAQGEER